MEQTEAMTPLQARLNLLGFLCIAGIIAANALYFQDAALFSKGKTAATKQEESKRAEQEPAQELKKADSNTTQSIPEVKAPPPEVSTSEDVSVEIVRAIQRELINRQYNPGKQDGAVGDQTRAAILAFEYDMGLPLTATPSEDVLQKIIFGVPGERRDPDAEDQMTAISMKIVKEVQRRLKELKYYAGDINGRIDGATRKAIREFEEDRKLKVKGRVSGRLLVELREYTR